MVRFYILRHGESSNNAKKADDVGCGQKEVEGRDPDAPLTERGYTQASDCAKFFAQLMLDPTPEKHRPRRVFTSLFTRAIQTSNPIAKALNCPLIAKPFLHEEGGIFNGKRSESSQDGKAIVHGITMEIARELAPAIKLESSDFASGQKGGWWRGGREKEEEARNRAKEVAEWMHSLAKEGEKSEDSSAVLIVTHGMFMNRLLGALLGCPENSAAFLAMNCSLTILEFQNGKVGVLASNFLEHLTSGNMYRTGHRCGGFELLVTPPFDGEIAESRTLVRYNCTKRPRAATDEDELPGGKRLNDS